MIGEKAADHILGRPTLSASNAEYYRSKAWEARQR